jgi:hypothetical protein
MMTEEPLQQPGNKPNWRATQHRLGTREKVELLGQVILETRKLERIKRRCKPSLMSSNNWSQKAS